MSVFKDKEKTKDGRQWRFKVYYHNTEGKLVPYTSKRYLLEKEAKAEERVFLLNRDAPVKKRFDVVADDYFEDAFKRLRESTVLTYKSNYENHIKPYFKNKFIDEISVMDIENWKNKLLDKGLSVDSCNQYYVVFKEIFSFANRKYELNYNPVELSGRFKKRNDEVVETSKKLRNPAVIVARPHDALCGSCRVAMSIIDGKGKHWRRIKKDFNQFSFLRNRTEPEDVRVI